MRSIGRRWRVDHGINRYQRGFYNIGDAKTFEF
jgi:hypothetical protein